MYAVKNLTSSSFLSTASIFFTCSVVAANEAPSFSRSSTISSGCVAAGKNCCGTSFMAGNANASAVAVAPMTHHRRSNARSISRRSLR